MDLTGKVALVTGASSGIGKSIALALGRRGAGVTLVARRAERLEEVAAEMRHAGGEAFVAPADVRSEEELCRSFDESQSHWGRLDALVNGAGVGRSETYRDGPSEAWREMLEVNVLALAVASREALRRFDPAQGGHIVNISSMAGHRVPPGGGFYAVTKFAVRALTETLRLQLRATGSPSRVSAISPGLVDTDFFQNFDERDRAKARERLSQLRVLDPDDVAAAVVYVLEAPAHVAIHDILLRPNEQVT